MDEITRNCSLPPVPKALITALESRFPLRITDHKKSDREIWMEAGRQELIKYLRTQYEVQNEMQVRVLNI